MFKKRQRAFSQSLIGKYPACDILNNAIRLILQDEKPNLTAVSEVRSALKKSGGYFHKDVEESILELERQNKI